MTSLFLLAAENLLKSPVKKYTTCRMAKGSSIRGATPVTVAFNRYYRYSVGFGTD